MADVTSCLEALQATVKVLVWAHCVNHLQPPFGCHPDNSDVIQPEPMPAMHMKVESHNTSTLRASPAARLAAVALLITFQSVHAAHIQRTASVNNHQRRG
jgi:hypothetical protein